MKALERLIDELILEVTLFPNTHYRTITENEIKAAILKMFEEKDELLKNVNSLFNPCGHTGFESCVCNVCGYPEPVKRIAKLNQKIAELEAENTRLFNLTGTYNTVLSNYSLKIKELEEQVEKLKKYKLFFESCSCLFAEGVELMTHMLPRVMRAVEPWLRERITDARFWDDAYDKTHTGEITLPTPTAEERKLMFERYVEQPNPLEGKNVIGVVV